MYVTFPDNHVNRSSQIHFVLPGLAELKMVVSRISHLSEDVAISANHVSIRFIVPLTLQEGKMELKVKSSKVQMTTTWTNLNIPTSTCELILRGLLTFSWW